MIQAQLVVCIIVGITDLSRRLPFIIATYLNRAPSGSLCVQHPPRDLFSFYLAPQLTNANPTAASAAEAMNMKMYWTMRNMLNVSADPSGEYICVLYTNVTRGVGLSSGGHFLRFPHSNSHDELVHRCRGTR